MKNSILGDTRIAKGDNFSLKQYLKNDLERNEMQKILYASTMGSIMYTQFCTHPDIAFVLGKTIKRVMSYLKRTKTYMFTYRKSKDLEIIMYIDFDFVGCQDSICSTSRYIYMLHPTMGYDCKTLLLVYGVVDGIKRPLKIYYDYNSTILYSNNNRSSTKSKFIDIKFLLLKKEFKINRFS
ncbi:hypothetical protein CR513_23328, partial [Mucuna pruriens]